MGRFFFFFYILWLFKIGVKRFVGAIGLVLKEAWWEFAEWTNDGIL